MQPGLHRVTRAQYDADPCPAPSLSASIAKIVVERSPAHAWLWQRVAPGVSISWGPPARIIPIRDEREARKLERLYGGAPCDVEEKK